MKLTSSYGGEFEVTEADLATVAPLGTPDDVPEDLRMQSLIFELKEALKFTNLDRVLPRGHWDAFLDEADWVHDDANFPGCTAQYEIDCPEDHLVWRAGSPERDSVFVRLQTEAVKDPIWDIEVMARPRMTSNGVDTRALPTINGEEYSPEDCVRDLGALLSVFRLYVDQGRL